MLIWLFTYLKKQKKKKVLSAPFVDSETEFSERNVTYYRSLNPENRRIFQQWINLFLADKRVTAIEVEVTREDKLLIASAAIIPVLAFPYYLYPNLTEILIYPNAFNNDYGIEGDGRNILGMVGTGPMEGKMILSKSALIQGFKNDNDKQNVGIHEFIHLVDKQGGETDGVPTMLLEHKLIKEWLGVVHKEIELIFKERSDINPYAATNNADFLAVTGEYFFESPELMKKKHLKLYTDMCDIFHQAPTLRLAKKERGIAKSKKE